MIECFELAFCALMFVFSAQYEPFFFFDYPGAGGISRDGVETGSWAVQCHDEGAESDRLCYIRQYLGTGRKSDMLIQIKAGGEAYLTAGAKLFPGTELGAGVFLTSGGELKLLPELKPGTELVANLYPGTEQVIRIDRNPEWRSAYDEPFVLDGPLMKELLSGRTLTTEWYEGSRVRRDEELTLAGLPALLDLVRRIVGGDPFELPPDSVYRFYFTQGAAYRNLYRAVEFSLKARYDWNQCPDPGFDVDAVVQAALNELPGAAGAGFADGFEDGDFHYQLKIRPSECQKYFDALRQGPRVIENLRYP